MKGGSTMNNSSMFDSYYTFMEKNSDPRTADWFFVSGLGPLVTLLSTYLYFCTSVGPRFMRDRKPFELKHTMLVYNFSQILMSAFLVYEGLASGWYNDYSYTCQPVDYSDNPKAMRMASAVWWYFMTKLIELLDTVFFVLRKKTRQISFLHLFHHTIMPICAWIGTKFLPGGHGTFLGVINSFIHIIMYGYYLVAGLGPEYQKYLWWKQHLTSLQLIQFVMIFTHNFTVMFRDCSYPKGINFLLSLNAGVFIYLFGKFYVDNYIKANRKKNDDVKPVSNGKAKAC
ncbi:elongation of very long chain fatty acids protein AAEL008004 [Aricia agestis]|uniref:elongation of very long chain fatty acids protein AAEL008004 n=1 Tax=Aricia agestis TaxID=91739 RepID=UPI001C209F89|nr:elongation of very long chain fatty acids protein AAEL008004 [Aricia agestis]